MKEIAEAKALISFLRKISERFVFPEIEEVASVDFSNILQIQAKPLSFGETSRVPQSFRFGFYFSQHNMD